MKRTKTSTNTNDLKHLEPGLYIVATPIGNTQDWTSRAVDTLSRVDLIAAEDTRILKKEMAKLGVKHQKIVSHHEHNEVNSTKGLMEALKAGKSVALASDAGTPIISDPGYKVIREAYKMGIKVIPIPGASSLTASLSISPLGGQTVLFGGFLPTQTEARKRSLRKHRRAADSMVFFEAPHRLRETLLDAESVLGPDTETLVCRELTKIYEEVLHASLGEVKKHFSTNEPRGEFTLIFKGSTEELLNPAETEVEVKKLLGYGRSASEIMDELQTITELTRKTLYDIISRVKKIKDPSL